MGAQETEGPRDLAQLVDREAPRLLAFVRRSCGDGSDAEDVVQETFANAIRGWGQLRDPSGARAWLYAIARRTCQRMHRRRSGEPRFFESLDELLPDPGATLPALVDGADPEGERQRSEAREIVERSLAELPDRFRQPLVLSDVAELTIAEIARILGIREATVKTRIHRARLKLRQRVAAGFAQRAVAPLDHARRICLDLVRAKLEAMDRHAPFPYSEEALCERCRTLLETLDLAGAACAALGREPLDPELRRRLAEAVRGS